MNKFEAERAWWSCFWDPMVRLGGKLVTYGPYAQDGVLAPESNQQVQNLILISRQWRNFPVCWDFILQFDLNLRSRDPSWGIRDITELKEVGAAQGLNLDQVLKHNFPHKELTQYNPKSSDNRDACQQQNSCVRQKGTREALIKTAPITNVPFRAFVIQDLLRSDLQPTL